MGIPAGFFLPRCGGFATLSAMMKFDPETMSPTKRKLALLASKIAVFNAFVITLVLLVVAPVMAFSDVGNFPTDRDRKLAAGMMVVCAAVAAGIGIGARKRVALLRDFEKR